MVKGKGEFVGIISTTDVLVITPDALDVLVEEARVEENYNVYKKNIAEGICENCRSYDEELIEINGQFLCDKCKNKLEARKPIIN